MKAKFEHSGERLKKARLEAGFQTARDFYKKFNLKASTYSAHESGRNQLSLKIAQKYASFLNTSPTWLLTGEEKQTEEFDKYLLHYGQVPRDILLNKLLNETTINFIKAAGLQKGMTIAEFGCGTGSVACWLAEYVGDTGTVYAIDKGYEQITITKKRASELGITNIECIRTEITKKPPVDKVDIVFMRCFLHHLTNPEEIIKLASDMLSPKGIIVCIEPIINSFWSYPSTPEIEKAKELYIELGKINNFNFDIGCQLHHLLIKQNTFENFEAYIHQPISLNTDDKSWIEMLTAECATKYIEENLIEETEIDNILLKINEYIQSKETIATLPQFIFISARKT